MKKPGASLFHGKPCSKCLNEPRVMGQRWGKQCLAQHNKEWHAREKLRIAQLRADASTLEAIMARLKRSRARNRQKRAARACATGGITHE